MNRELNDLRKKRVQRTGLGTVCGGTKRRGTRVTAFGSDAAKTPRPRSLRAVLLGWFE